MIKKITTINIDEELYEKAQKYCPYHGYRSFSQLVEELVRKELEGKDKK